MSRLLLLTIFAVWLAGYDAMSPPVWGMAHGLACFAAGYVAIVLVAAGWARMLSRHIDHERLHAGLRRFNRGLTVARTMVPLWLAFGLFGPIGWGAIVLKFVWPATVIGVPHGGSDPPMLALPALILGTAPAILAWVGLWWAQYPAERALREHSLIEQLEHDMPVHAAPELRGYLLANMRQQVLFMLLPILLILLLHDLLLIGTRVAGLRIENAAAFDNWVMLPAGVAVFLLAPEVLRRVLDTRPLPDSPLRQRLESLCRRAGLKYRAILLWNTQYSMGNAAVMGLLPRWRYILLSDLLIETMTDQQIEAVFAHEVGHIVHRHMLWYTIFFGILLLATVGPGHYIDLWVNDAIARLPRYAQPEAIRTAISIATLLGTIVVVFGYLSRRFERQADVFAARMMESDWGNGGRPTGPEGSSHVGQYGARVFASALGRVAAINNIPVGAPSWCHGSIANRMAYLDRLSHDPARTGAFDRTMSRLYATMVIALIACGMVAVAGG